MLPAFCLIFMLFGVLSHSCCSLSFPAPMLSCVMYFHFMANFKQIQESALIDLPKNCLVPIISPHELERTRTVSDS
ncbi:hypothetical protein BDQ17DRAFT_501431 [Cyathus striatus]|nr:hypothetical protein BDQ17DRAFT_501431 [Cyathus striatus]